MESSKKDTEIRNQDSKQTFPAKGNRILPEIIAALFILVLCLVHAKTVVHNADFGPLNGTFQDFNPIRRFLSGQIPYRDFSDYLGLGHLYLGTITTVLFGKTFAASKTAFVFLAFFSLSLISLTLGTAILKSRLRALSLTGILLSALLIKPLFFTRFALSEEARDAFDYALKNGNSARMVRGFILPLVCAILILLCSSEKFSKKVFPLFILSFCSGFILPWSNDYGISLFLCFCIFFIFAVFSRTRSVGKTFLFSLCHVIFSLLGAAVFVEIFTLGHLPQWVRSTFGIGGFQRWYPNTEKHFYIFSIDLTWTAAFQAVLTILYLVRLFKCRASGPSLLRYGIPGLANMTGFCALNEYYMISGDSAREVPLIILSLTLFFETVHFVLSLFADKEQKLTRALFLVSLVCMTCWVVPAAYDEFIYWKMTKKEGVYVPQLGGNVTELGDSLTETEKRLGDAKIFSTYASAMELVTGQFQPSGTDYIIHVLGDENRESYLDLFRTGDFDYAVTIKETYSPWEYYIQRSNWYFYRELYRGWHPVFSNKYQLYWERNEAGTDHIINTDMTGISVEVVQNEPTEAKIIVRTDKQVNGFADVAVDYSVNKNGSALSKLMFQRMLYVSADRNNFSEQPFYGTNYLRESSTEFIPVTVVDGYGEIRLNSVPKENTNLVIHSASCEEIFTAPLDHVEVTGVGYHDDTPFLRIPKIPQNRAALSGAEELTLGEYVIPVLGLAEDTDGLMLLADLDEIPFAELEQFIGKQCIASVRRTKSGSGNAAE